MLSQTADYRADEDPLFETVRAVLGALEALDTESALVRLQDIDAHVHTALYAYLAGLAAMRLGEYGKTIELMDEAHRLEPDAPEPVEVLAALHGHLGDIANSLYFLKLSTTLRPPCRDFELLPDWVGSAFQHFLNTEETPLLTRARQQARRFEFETAINLYRQHIEINATDLNVWRELARTSIRAGQPFDAAMAMHVVSELKDTLTVADHALIAEILCASGQSGDGLEHYRRTLRNDPDTVACWSPVLAALTDSPLLPESVLSGEEACWARAMETQIIRDQPAVPARRPVRTALANLRIGLVCGRSDPAGPLDLFIRAVSQAPELPWNLITYANNCPDNEILRRAAAISQALIDTTSIDGETLLTIIGNDDLDVLIDPDGAWFASRVEPGLLADVPLRLLFLGRPENAALRGFDGILGDQFSYAAGPSSFVRILTTSAPLISAWDLPATPPSRNAVSPTIGCWARPADVTQDEILSWAAILNANPEARIKLSFRDIGGPAGAANLLERAAPVLVESRILFSDEAPGDFVRDLSCLLDPVGRSEPYTALLALAAGVPVIVPGNRARCQASLEALASSTTLPLVVSSDSQERIAQAMALLDPQYIFPQPARTQSHSGGIGHQLFSTLIEALRLRTRRIREQP